MENIEQQESNATLDFLNSQVGDNEGSQALEPGEVVIASVQMKTHNKQEKKMDNPLVEVHCKHPDREELIKLTQIKRINGDKMINVALFANVDNDGKFFKDSGIACLLTFVGVATLKDLEGHKIDVVKESETSKYLALKCYK